MYQSLLVVRYLTSRIIPLIAVAAVALCVTLVIVVVSVMTGFLDMLRNSGRTLVGDVIVSHDIVGIPYYEELIAEIEALPEAEAAAPVVETFGLMSMPYGTSGGNRIEMLSVWGIDPVQLQRVIDFKRTLYWKPLDEAQAASMAKDDPRRDPAFDALDAAMTMRGPNGQAGVIPGIEISPFNQRQDDGSYRIGPSGDPPWRAEYWMPRYTVTLTLVPVSDRGTIKADRKQNFAIVNEFQTGVFQFDHSRVLAPLAEVQDMLGLSAAEVTDRNDLDEDGKPRVLGISPARATTILVRAKPGVSPAILRDAVEGACSKFLARKQTDESVRALRVLVPPMVDVKTWEQRLKDLIGPVEKERALMRALFSLVYVVCAGLVLAIFWAIVAEKTRDIGILRSVGAGRVGILSIFLAYGLVIGVIGSIVGLGLAWLVVDHINEIHTALGHPPPSFLWIASFLLASLALFAAIASAMRGSVLYGLLWSIATLLLAGLGVLFLFLRDQGGFTIWDPKVYYFSRIPNQIDLANALLTMAFATVFSVIGAAIPAAKAADTDPVRSLRYE
ncbi:MAG: FtsX-like permease family protein [Phycisphaerales bacterium]